MAELRAEREKIEAERAEGLKMMAELQALRAQLSPQVNTENSVDEDTKTDNIKQEG